MGGGSARLDTMVPILLDLRTRRRRLGREDSDAMEEIDGRRLSSSVRSVIKGFGKNG